MVPDMMSVQGTNLGQALSVAMDAFSETDRRHRVLVVITDGEDHENQMEEAVDRAVEEGVRLYPVGIGSTEGVPIPELNTEGRAQGFKRDRDGAVVTTRLDESTLQMMADRTGGSYYRASPGGSELLELVAEVSAGDGQEFEVEQVTVFDEQYQIFLGLALTLLVGEILIPDRRRPQTSWLGRFQ